MPLDHVRASLVVSTGLLLIAGSSYGQPAPISRVQPGAASTPAAAAAQPGVVLRSPGDAPAAERLVRQPSPNAARAALAATTRAFTYQGLLRASGMPLNGLCDLQFTVWSAASGGAALSPTQQLTTTASDGLFTVMLNDAAQFPDSIFDGRAVWVEIAVRSPSGAGAFTTLSPRQPLTAAPVASTLTPHALIRAGDTYNGYPAMMVDARAELYGNPEALRLHAAPSGLWLSFNPSALWADSDVGNGVVGVTRAGVGVFGGAAEPAGWAGYFNGNVKITGRLEASGTNSLIAINSVGPLPLTSASFTTNGGTLRIQYSGSGYSASPNTLIGMDVRLDGNTFDQTGIFANQAGMHLAFVSKEWVLTGIAAGTHTITLAPMSGTFTDSGDIFSVTVTEMPN